MELHDMVLRDLLLGADDVEQSAGLSSVTLFNIACVAASMPWLWLDRAREHAGEDATHIVAVAEARLIHDLRCGSMNECHASALNCCLECGGEERTDTLACAECTRAEGNDDAGEVLNAVMRLLGR